MHRFYQGQLDFFCAIYAVINALTALYGISLSQARSLFATALADIAKQPVLWRATLCSETDFYWVVDYMLLNCAKGSSYPIRATRPFADRTEISESAADLDGISTEREVGPAITDPDIIWPALEGWLPKTQVQPRAGAARRIALLRFHRYIRYMDRPIVSHWSMMDCHYGGVFQLRDASKEESALYSLDRGETVFSPKLVSEKNPIRIEPESVYFMERR